MTLLERYEQEAVELRRPRHGKRIITDFNALRDVQRFMGEEQRAWKPWMREIEESGVPVGLPGGLAGIEVNPPAFTLPTVTANATEAALWPVATWTPISANSTYPKIFRVVAWGTQTTAATPGTMLFQPRLGTTVAGIDMGVSVTAAQTASETTTVWRIEGNIICRIGGTASTATAVSSFKYEQGTATTGGSAVLPAIEQIFGGLVASYDASIAQGLWMGVKAVTSTTNTFVPQAVIWLSYN
jgi:hypothetical protein